VDLDSVDFETTLKTLEKINNSFPKDSEEAQAVTVAAHSLVYVQANNTRDAFMDTFLSKNRRLNIWQYLSLRGSNSEIDDSIKPVGVDQVDDLVKQIISKMK